MSRSIPATKKAGATRTGRLMSPHTSAKSTAPRPSWEVPERCIGGFFGLALPGAPKQVGRGLAEAWGVAGTRHAWSNATSAFAALVTHLRPGAVWLPGYICADFVAAVPQDKRRFFPLRHDLAPDIAALEGLLCPGDMLLAVDMFGRAPGKEWRDFVAAHREVTFVEDCAQALDIPCPWGDWRLFSPRKLLGIPEGGLLAPVSARARSQVMDLPGPVEAPDAARVMERLAPALTRLGLPESNDLWHPMHQAAEAREEVTGHAMSVLARALLAVQDSMRIAAARRRNFRHLAARLTPQAAFSESDPAFVPFGFPVLLPPEDRDRVRAHLHARRIFPAVHWTHIAAPPSFINDHLRARSLLTLPCDHRYDLEDMDRLADIFNEAVN